MALRHRFLGKHFLHTLTPPSRLQFLRFKTMAATGHLFSGVKHPNNGYQNKKITFSNKVLTQTDLCFLPATELLELFKAKVITPVDLLNAQMAQIKKFNSRINAVTEAHYFDALKQAQESTKRYEDGTARPLEGLTCAIKDEVDVVGWRTTMGTIIRKDAPIATKDAPLTTFLRDAGLVFHVQTNIPEYYCNLVTWNHLFGICRNPWNLDYTPGGSSGGSAASLTAGFTTFATGSDMGGSIRFPAAMSGLYGFKPPFGRVPTSHVHYESEGPMTRSFEDLCLLQTAMTGRSRKVMSTLEEKLHYPLNYPPIHTWKIAYDTMENWGIPLDKTVKNSMSDVVARLSALGAEVKEVDLGFRASDFSTYALGIFSTSLGAFCFEEPKKHREKITRYIENCLDKYETKLSPQHLVNAEEWMDEKHAQIQEKVFANNFDAIIMPTMCSPYLKADMGTHPENTVITINGKQHSAENWDYSFTWPWNMLGYYPVVNVPVGITPEQIPLGMQIIADVRQDLKAFQVAAAWSKVGPRFFQPDSRPKLLNEELEKGIKARL